MDVNNINCAVKKVSEQVTLVPLNKQALFQHGYNPSIIRHNGNLLMAYRWHGAGTLGTWLAMAELDEAFNPIENTRIRVMGVNDTFSVDDPRLFIFGGQLWCSYVCSTWPNMPPTSVVVYGRIYKQEGVWTIDEGFRVDYGKNDGTTMEKNWVFWDHEGTLSCIYNNQPNQKVIRIQGPKVVDVFESVTPHWPYGKIHGGTAPIPYQARLLRFFHTRMDNEPMPARWRYYIGACIMDPEPPFEIYSVSSEPIIRGSEDEDMIPLDRASCFHRKLNVVFPGGCIKDGEDFLLSIGINDCQSAIARLKPADLKLL